VEEFELYLKCPQCRAPFVDFGGCAAVACSACDAYFCGWCQLDCGNGRVGDAQAHQHAPACDVGSGNGGLFPDSAVWKRVQDARKAEAVQAYLQTIDNAGIREQVALAKVEFLGGIGIDVSDYLLD
jgi:hypothetical protein